MYAYGQNVQWNAENKCVLCLCDGEVIAINYLKGETCLTHAIGYLS